jgi:hypothetical protein
LQQLRAEWRWLLVIAEREKTGGFLKQLIGLWSFYIQTSAAGGHTIDSSLMTFVQYSSETFG